MFYAYPAADAPTLGFAVAVIATESQQLKNKHLSTFIGE